MGRRALPKIDPALELSGHFRESEELPVPFDLLSLFGRTAPLEVEVGSGKGLFLAAASQAHPERDYLGIEISFKYARFAAARLTKLKAPNAKAVCGDALALFSKWIPDNSISAVHVYFPDP